MTGRLARLVAGLALIAVALTAQAAGAQSSEEQVVRLELVGTVDPLVADYLEGAIARAQEEGAGAVLIVIDTPGGLDSSMRQITEAILNARVPVITYVAPAGARAASAGAFILLSAPVAAMSPGTNVGAATPVGLSGGDLSDKIANDAAGYLRSIAETYDRNVEIAESFVTDAESISAEEALSGGVIDRIAGTEEELLATVDGSTVALGTGETVVIASSGPVALTALLRALITMVSVSCS